MRNLLVGAAVLFAATVVGCGSTKGSAINFAVPGRSLSMQPFEHRVLSKKVYLPERIATIAVDGDVTVTFAVTQHDAWTLVVDPESLETRTSVSFVYTPHARTERPAHLVPEADRVVLRDGRTISFRTDEQSGRVFADGLGADGAPVAVSNERMQVIGVPRAATADGQHVVVAFVTSTDDGFELVATSLDTSR